jgi:hypothetical protein
MITPEQIQEPPGYWVTITIERPNGSTEGTNYFAVGDRETHHEALIHHYDSIMRRVENG